MSELLAAPWSSLAGHAYKYVCVSPRRTTHLGSPSPQPYLPPLILQKSDFLILVTTLYTLDLPLANMKSFTGVVALLSW